MLQSSLKCLRDGATWNTGHHLQRKGRPASLRLTLSCLVPHHTVQRPSHVRAASISPAHNTRWYSIRSILQQAHRPRSSRGATTAVIPQLNWTPSNSGSISRASSLRSRRPPSSVHRLINHTCHQLSWRRSTSSAYQPPFLLRHCRMRQTRSHSSSGGLPILVAVQPLGTTTRSVG